MGLKSPARGECGPCAEAPACFQDVAYGCSAPSRPCRRKLPRHQKTFRQAGQLANTATPPGIPAHPAPLPSGCRASGVPHPSCPPRGFQRKRKRQRPMRPPRRAEAPPGVPGPVRRTRWPPSPAGREAFFLAPFRARARKEPRRGVDGPPALFEKGMLIDAQEHRDVLVPHSLRHTFDVRPVHKRQRGEGVPQVIRPDAPRDARRRPGRCASRWKCSGRGALYRQ